MKLKKTLAALLAAAMAFSLFMATGAAAVEFNGGNGLSGSPYQISTEEQLLEFGKLVTDGNTDLCAELTADITVADWTITDTNNNKYSSIGKWADYVINDSPSPYVGVFDGKGFKLTLTKAGANGTTTEKGRVALFNTIGANGVVKNLDLAVYFSGSMYIAGVAGTNYGTIRNVTVAGTIAATSNNSYAGGVAGRSGCKVEEGIVTSTGRILDCLNTANVTGKQYVGGIAGDFLGEMRRCGNTGTITGTSYLGGLLSMGQNVNSTSSIPVERRFIVSDCYNAGKVVGTSQNFAALLGGVDNSRFMADWKDGDGEYPDFQVSGVFNYGGMSGYTKDYLSIIALLSTEINSSYYTAENITKIFSNTYYLKNENSGGRLFYPTNLNNNETVNTVIISKSADDFANAQMAALLNNSRTDDAPWEYVQDAPHPTLIKGFVDPDENEEPDASFSVGEHSETLTEGTAGTASFAVTAENMPNGIYTANLTDAPAGVTVADGSVTITGGSGTVTLNTSSETPEGSYEITLTLSGSDASASAVLSLTIAPGSTIPDTDPVEFDGGDGSSGSPYQISTEEQLLEFGKLVTDGNTDLCAELTADITVADWTITDTNNNKYSSIGKWGAYAINDSPSPYIGVFDGKGFTLTLTKAGANGTTTERGRVALFHTIGTGGVVQNLDLQVNFSGSVYIAGVAGSNYGTIRNVTVAGTIDATGARSYAGGVAGLSGCKFDGEDNVLPGRILDCLNTTDVTGKSDVGGIAGSFLGEMERCGNTGTITGITRLGGLLSMGENVNPTDTLPDEKRFIVSDCYNAGQVISGYALPHFAALLGGGDNAEFMADWRDEQTDEYPDFQVSGVFNYGSVIASGIPFRDSTIIATLCNSPSFGNYSAADIANIFSNTYYLNGCGGQLFVPSVLNGSDGLGTNTVKTVIKSKTAEEFASAAMAALLNNGREGDDAPWEYVEDALYPTLKRLADPGNTDPGNTDPGNTDPSNTDPGNTDPGNTVEVPGGGTVTVPAYTEKDDETGVVTLPSGGEIILTDGATKISVPEGTTIDPADGVITVPNKGVLTLPVENGAEFLVPSGTTIDSKTGTVSVAADAVLTLPGGDGAIKADEDDDIEIAVPEGTAIDPATGLATAKEGGRIILPGPNRVIDTDPQSVSGRRNASLSTISGTGDDENDDLIYEITPGTTVNPYTGVVTVTNGGEITLPGGSKMTVAPGATIDPFSGEIDEGGARNSGSGCDAGMAGFALALLIAGAALIVSRKRAR